MLRVVICDDRADQLTKIHDACKNYFARHPNFDTEIITFDNPLVCLEKLSQIGGCDIALLDICMPGISGISVATELIKQHEKTQVIFITTSDEYAVQAFIVGAQHYITKPFTQDSFNLGMDRVMKKFQASPDKWFFVNGEGGTVYKVNVGDILYIESFRNGRTVHTLNGTFTENKQTLQAMLAKLTELCPRQFISPYRGYIVNFAAAEAVTKEGILLKNKVTVPIKPDSFRKLRDSYIDYQFSKED